MSSITETLFKAWNFRHACKSFDATGKISDDDFNTILESGRLSPSSFGLEPWQFIVVQNENMRELLKPLCWGAQGQLPTCSHFVIILARKAKTMDPHGQYITQTIMRDTQQLPEDVVEMRSNFFANFIDNDFAYAGNDRAKFEWASRQCYIALGNMMTTAALLGHDSCPIEGFKKEDVEKLLVEQNLLDADTFGVACMVAFGKREKDPERPKTRRTQEQVVQWVK